MPALRAELCPSRQLGAAVATGPLERRRAHLAECRLRAVFMLAARAFHKEISSICPDTCHERTRAAGSRSSARNRYTIPQRGRASAKEPARVADPGDNIWRMRSEILHIRCTLPGVHQRLLPRHPQSKRWISLHSPIQSEGNITCGTPVAIVGGEERDGRVRRQVSTVREADYSAGSRPGGARGLRERWSALRGLLPGQFPTHAAVAAVLAGGDVWPLCTW